MRTVIALVVTTVVVAGLSALVAFDWRGAGATTAAGGCGSMTDPGSADTPVVPSLVPERGWRAVQLPVVRPSSAELGVTLFHPGDAAGPAAIGTAYWVVFDGLFLPPTGEGALGAPLSPGLRAELSTFLQRWTDCFTDDGPDGPRKLFTDFGRQLLIGQGLLDTEERSTPGILRDWRSVDEYPLTVEDAGVLPDGHLFLLIRQTNERGFDGMFRLMSAWIFRPTSDGWKVEAIVGNIDTVPGGEGLLDGTPVVGPSLQQPGSTPTS